MNALTAQQAPSCKENVFLFSIDLCLPEEVAQFGAKVAEMEARIGGELQS